MSDKHRFTNSLRLREKVGEEWVDVLPPLPPRAREKKIHELIQQLEDAAVPYNYRTMRAILAVLLEFEKEFQAMGR